MSDSNTESVSFCSDSRTFRYFASSLPGRFATWTICYLDGLLPGQFAAATFCTCGRFDTRTFCYIRKGLQFMSASLSRPVQNVQEGSETSWYPNVQMENVQVANHPGSKAPGSESSNVAAKHPGEWRSSEMSCYLCSFCIA